MAKFRNKLLNLCVFIITILAAHLLAYSIYEYMLEYRGATSPWKFTAIGMLIIVVIFYPAVKLIDQIIESITKHLFRHGKSKFGTTFGIFVVFFILLFIIYFLYAKHWFHKDLLKFLFH